MFRPFPRLNTMLMTAIVALSCSSSQAYLADKFSVPWKSANCHMGIEEFSLLYTLAEKAQEATRLSSQKMLDAPVVAAPQQAPLLPPHLQKLADELEQMYRSKDTAPVTPGFKEAQEKIAAAKARYATMTRDQLIVIAQHDPLIRQCRLLPLDYLKDRSRYYNDSSSHLLDHEVPLLVMLALADADKFQFALNSPSFLTYEEMLDASLVPIEKPEGRLYYPYGMPWKWNYDLADAINKIIWGVLRNEESAINQSGQMQTLRKLSSKVVTVAGQPIQYQASLLTEDVQKTGLSASQMISPKVKSQLLFDDSVLNSFKVPYEIWGSTGKVPASFFKVGESASEQSLKKNIEKCFSTFKSTGDGGKNSTFASQIVDHFNLHCHQGDFVLLFYPAEVVSMVGVERKDVELTLPLIFQEERHSKKGRYKEVETAEVFEKEFLKISGHRTDFNVTIQAKILFTTRAAFTEAFRNSANYLAGKKLSEKELQIKVDQIFARLSHVFNLMQDKRNYDELKKIKFDWFADGTIAAMMALNAGSADEATVRIGYKQKDSIFEIIGLQTGRAAAGSVLELLKSSLTNEQYDFVKQRLNESTETQTSSCVKQLQLLDNTLVFALRSDDSRKHREEFLKKLKILEVVMKQSELAMNDLCRAAFSDEMEKVLKNAYVAANKLPK